MDPISDKFANLSPFNYASNNPVTNLDLWGLQGFNFNKMQQAPEIVVGRAQAIEVKKGLQAIVSLGFTGLSAVYSFEKKMIGDFKNMIGLEPVPVAFPPLLKLEFEKPDGSNDWDATIVPISEKNDPNEILQSLSDDALDALGTNPAIPQTPKDVIKELVKEGLNKANEIVKDNNNSTSESSEKRPENISKKENDEDKKK